MTRGLSPDSHRSAAGPTAAESAKSVLARALSAHVEWLDGSSPLDATEVTGVVLDRPAAPSAEPLRPVLVEIADVAPLPTRDRVRSRVRLHGHAAPEPDRPGAIRLQLVAAELHEGDGRTPVCPADLRAAEPGLIAAGEGAFLCHLAQDHGDLLRILTRLVDRELLEGARRVVPLALDRHGLTLRVEYRRGHRDTALSFATPATSFDEIRAGLRDLATHAHGVGVGPRDEGDRPARSARRSLRDLLQAGPAAARLCAADDANSRLP